MNFKLNKIISYNFITLLLLDIAYLIINFSIIKLYIFIIMLLIFILDYFNFKKYIIQNYYYDNDKNNFIICCYDNNNILYEIELSNNKFRKLKRNIDKYNILYINFFGYIKKEKDTN